MATVESLQGDRREISDRTAAGYSPGFQRDKERRRAFEAGQKGETFPWGDREDAELADLYDQGRADKERGASRHPERAKGRGGNLARRAGRAATLPAVRSEFGQAIDAQTGSAFRTFALALGVVALYLFLSNAGAVASGIGLVDGALRWLLDPGGVVPHSGQSAGGKAGTPGSSSTSSSPAPSGGGSVRAL